jgi:amino acid transporter
VTEADMARFTSSSSLLGDLATIYVGRGIGDVFDIFAMLSALGTALATTAAGSRILFALLRDIAPESPLGRIESGTGTPRNAALLILIVGLIGYEVERQLFGASASDAFFWASTVAALLILLAYLLVSVSAGVSVWQLASGARRLTLLIPLVAIVAIVFTLWVNVFPVQPGAYAVLPWLVLGWIAIPVIALIARPRITVDISAGLVSSAAPGKPV